jgi:hypothetical protein
MQQDDPEFIQILNIIRRGQRLVLQARKEGADTQLSEELINEAKYALKIDKREEAVDFAKKCIVEVIRAKREMDTENLTQEGALEKLTKEELRQKCKELGLNSLGLKSELVERIRERLMEMRETEPEIDEEAVFTEQVQAEPLKEDEEEEEEDVKVLKLPDSDGEVDTGVKALTKNAWNPKKAAKDLTPGLSYLIEEKRPERFFHIYKALKELGMDGMVISRTNPKLLARTYGVDETESVWLTGKEIQGDIRSVLPILEFIMSIYEEFMDQTQNGIILLDGLEYLLTNNKFNSVLRFIRQLVDNVSQTECILMVALSPDALDSTEVTLLEKDLLPLNYIE